MFRTFKNFSMAALLPALTLLYACSGSLNDRPAESRYEMLKAHADEIKVINTHEHQRWSEENAVMCLKLPHLIHSSYLGADVVSAGGSWIDNAKLDR